MSDIFDAYYEMKVKTKCAEEKKKAEKEKYGAKTDE